MTLDFKKLAGIFCALLLLTGAAFQFGGVRFDLLTVTSSSSTVVLTKGHKQVNVATGSANQVYTLPDATTLQAGYWYEFINEGSGTLTISNSSSVAIVTLPAASSPAEAPSARLYLTSSATTGGPWSVAQAASSSSSGAGPRSEVQVHTRNGYGSTNTMIPRFTTALRNVGTAITYADNSTDGASFTINEDGIYSIYFQIQASGASPNQAGISINSNQLTTVVNSLSYSRTNGALIRQPFSSDDTEGYADVAWTGYLDAGDVIRPHTRGEASDAQELWNFGIVKVAD